jgi:hypothetical protein
LAIPNIEAFVIPYCEFMAKRLHHRPKTFKSPKPVFEGLAEGQNFLGASHTKPTSHIIPTNDAKNA